MLVAAGVQLYLEHLGRDVGHVQHFLELLAGEVGKPDGAYLAGGQGLFHHLPRLGVRAVGLVQKQQVDVVGAEAIERRVDGRHAVGGAVVAGPQLRGDEELAAGDAAFAHRLADGHLVVVAVGSVDVAEAGLNGLGQVLGHLGRGHLEDPVAHGRDLHAVGKLEIDHSVPSS